MQNQDFSQLMTYLPFLGHGLVVTVELSVISSALALAIGTILGLARAFSGAGVNIVVGFYVDVMRSIPLLVVLVYSYFALPLLVGRSISSFMAAVLGLSIWVGAYVTEAVRAGVIPVRRQQLQAGLALGMTQSQAIRRIVLPQALVRMLPVLGSIIVRMVKDTALASAIAAPELLRQSQIVATQTYDPFSVLTLVMVVYFVLIFPVAKGSDWLYVRLASRAAG